MKKKLIIIGIAFLLIITFFLLYSRYISTSGLIVKEYKVVDPKIESNFHGLKVVHLSDIHFGRVIDEKRFKDIVAKVNTLKPDLIVLTGDLFDRDVLLDSKQQNIVIDSLKAMNAKLGKYGIMGNHDAKHDYFGTILSNGGFTNLNNKFELVYNLTSKPIIITGMSSNIEDKTLISKKLEDLNLYLDEFVEMKDAYKILIMHEPDYIDKIDSNLFDLVLAGHSHNGQVRLPLVGALILPPGGEKYYNEHYSVGKTELYVSSGIGTSVINFRFMNKPSFNFYRITNK